MDPATAIPAHGLWCLAPIADIDDNLLAWLTSEEHDELAHAVHARRRREFVNGRALTRSVLADLLALAPTIITARRDERGRPVWLPGSGIDANISHCDGWVATAVVARGRVGIDCERATPPADWRRLLDLCCHPEEQATVAHDPQRFIPWWCAKEAWLKRAGTGLGGDPRDLQFDGATIAHRDGRTPVHRLHAEETTDLHIACCTGDRFAPVRIAAPRSLATPGNDTTSVRGADRPSAGE